MSFYFRFQLFIVLFIPLIIPDVTVLCNSYPNGFPIAYTLLPNRISSESPSFATGRFFIFVFIIAKSKSSFDHITVPLSVTPFFNVI